MEGVGWRGVGGGNNVHIVLMDKILKNEINKNKKSSKSSSQLWPSPFWMGSGHGISAEYLDYSSLLFLLVGKTSGRIFLDVHQIMRWVRELQLVALCTVVSLPLQVQLNGLTKFRLCRTQSRVRDQRTADLEICQCLVMRMPSLLIHILHTRSFSPLPVLPLLFFFFSDFEL